MTVSFVFVLSTKQSNQTSKFGCSFCIVCMFFGVAIVAAVDQHLRIFICNDFNAVNRWKKMTINKGTHNTDRSMCACMWLLVFSWCARFILSLSHSMYGQQQVVNTFALLWISNINIKKFLLSTLRWFFLQPYFSAHTLDFKYRLI